MELHQLAYFVAVAEEASFTRAAARVHVAQPGVSAQVARLERELGQPLLDRSGRTVRLTEVGAAVLPYARSALEAVAGARLAVDELTGLVRGHVTAGMVGSVSSGELDLPGLLADFHRDHPAVEITLVEAGSDRLLEELRAGRLDLALVGLGTRTPAGVDLQVVVSEPLAAVVGHGDPFAGRRTVALADLQERTLISLPVGTGVRACLDEALLAAGLRPRIAFEAGDLRVLAQLAGRGLGVAILPATAAAARPTELRAVPVTRPRLRGRLALAWRPEGPASPAARALIARARALLPEVAADSADPVRG
jgi:DNA-binding transcriptional LysR family regulator